MHDGGRHLRVSQRSRHVRGGHCVVWARRLRQAHDGVRGREWRRPTGSRCCDQATRVEVHLNWMARSRTPRRVCRAGFSVGSRTPRTSPSVMSTATAISTCTSRSASSQPTRPDLPERWRRPVHPRSRDAVPSARAVATQSSPFPTGEAGPRRVHREQRLPGEPGPDSAPPGGGLIPVADLLPRLRRLIGAELFVDLEVWCADLLGSFEGSAIDVFVEAVCRSRCWG